MKEYDDHNEMVFEQKSVLGKYIGTQFVNMDKLKFNSIYELRFTDDDPLVSVYEQTGEYIDQWYKIDVKKMFKKIKSK